MPRGSSRDRSERWGGNGSAGRSFGASNPVERAPRESRSERRAPWIAQRARLERPPAAPSHLPACLRRGPNNDSQTTTQRQISALLVAGVLQGRTPHRPPGPPKPTHPPKTSFSTPTTLNAQPQRPALNPTPAEKRSTKRPPTRSNLTSPLTTHAHYAPRPKLK